MSASLRILAAITSTLLSSGVANAAGGGEGNALADFGWYTLNFVLLLAALVHRAEHLVPGNRRILAVGGGLLQAIS